MPVSEASKEQNKDVMVCQSVRIPASGTACEIVNMFSQISTWRSRLLPEIHMDIRRSGQFLQKIDNNVEFHPVREDRIIHRFTVNFKFKMWSRNF